MIWGGKFGTKKTKIYGAWNPFVYPKDKSGQNLYLVRDVRDTDPDDPNYECFICPCDGQKKWVKYSPNEYESVTTVPTVVKDFHGYDIDCYYYDNMKTCFTKQANGVGLEKAEISVDNFGKFNFNAYTTTSATSKRDWVQTTVDEGVPAFCEPAADVFEYTWENTDLKMSSLEYNMDIFYIENVSLQYLTEINGTDQHILISHELLNSYERDNIYGYMDDSHDTIGTTITSYTDKDTQMIDDGSTITGIKYSATAYGKSIVFYINATWEMTNCEGELMNKIIRIPVGIFYIVEDWNYQIGSIQDHIYPIDAGLEEVPFLERMEKCRAPQTFAINTDRNTCSANYRYSKEYDESELTVFIDPKTMKPYEPNSDTFTRKNGSTIRGNLRIIKQNELYYKWTRTKAPDYTTLGHRIIIDAVHYPGVYRLVGETYARSRKDGKDQRYQFEIPLCKMSSETNLTLEAAGDPTTFSMNMKVLRRDDGVMMKITQYDVEKAKFDGYNSGSTNVVPSDGVISTDPVYDDDEGR